MPRRSSETIKTTKPPKYIADTGMNAEGYYYLKIYIKSIIVPGTPPLEYDRFDVKDDVYCQWLHNALKEIGPRFFPGGEGALVWPLDYTEIFKTVHRAIRVLTPKIKHHYREFGRGYFENQALDNQTDSAQAEAYDADDSGDTEVENGEPENCDDDYDGDTAVEEDAMMVDGEVVPEELDEEITLITDQDDQGEYMRDKRMDAAATELKDLIDLMKPESFSQLPDLADDCFDWEEAEDSNILDTVRHLAILDQ
ncbi:hypothetical protein L873DRAFT_1845696 [Choiromyces venosus 120613-1]|uniref:Uncharacterized protein n=1 Tax=Choiromyces venosus 120613-1 TaxID=1336337 RepID=A0A3N4JFW8_9PEZI|nr:hypothetical protein L873DRAFT_1845696 [Choiromyces venosus 120613-1]